jgi:hypothetical protein
MSNAKNIQELSDTGISIIVKSDGSILFKCWGKTEDVFASRLAAVVKYQRWDVDDAEPQMNGCYYIKKEFGTKGVVRVKFDWIEKRVYIS